MSINKVNTTTEEKSFNFLTNQSSILRTVETNNITVNGVNVIVDKPKRGDVMCITHYKENDTLLGADSQKVVWIDGLSIDPKQLSQEYEPVGICLVVKGNKALVRYREEKNLKWAVAKRLQIPYPTQLSPGMTHLLKITIDNTVHSNKLALTADDTSSGVKFTNKLNSWLVTNFPGLCSAELAELNTDLPAVDTSEPEQSGPIVIKNYRIIVNVLDDPTAWSRISIEKVGNSRNVTCSHINAVSSYYKNNGFIVNVSSDSFGGCCRANYSDFIQKNQSSPSVSIANINFNSNLRYPYCAVKAIDFDSSPNCQFLRDNFANYDEYLESMLVKVPCGAGGTITDSPNGKENTYKLADCTFLDNGSEPRVKPGTQSILYPAANWAASISLNAPKLGKGNWWLPSSSEIVEMMRDVTYGTTFWDTKPDIINRVLIKLTPEYTNTGWSMLSASDDRWTSSKYGGLGNTQGIYFYSSSGSLKSSLSSNSLTVSPITIYEF